MLPAKVDLLPHEQGTTWEGISIGPITVDGLPPTYPCFSCRIQFRLLEDGTLGYELNSSPGVGEGTITIVDADLWQFNVPTQVLPMPAGDYEWEFMATDTATVTLPYYRGIFKYISPVVHD